MIQALIFDLDGTLVQTEVLKATSYARAAHILTKGIVSEEQVLDAFKNYIGQSREKVLFGLTNMFLNEFKEGLQIDDLSILQGKFIAKRLEIYSAILADEQLLSAHFCTNTLGVFHKAKGQGLKVVLATMSHLPEAKRITSMMGIYGQLDLILTKDDVAHGKPHPEIYNLAKSKLGLAAKACLVMEDSVNGIKAAQAANLAVFAVTNSITRKSVHECQLLSPQFVVDDLSTLENRVFDFIQKNS